MNHELVKLVVSLPQEVVNNIDLLQPPWGDIVTQRSKKLRWLIQEAVNSKMAEVEQARKAAEPPLLWVMSPQGYPVDPVTGKILDRYDQKTRGIMEEIQQEYERRKQADAERKGLSVAQASPSPAPAAPPASVLPPKLDKKGEPYPPVSELYRAWCIEDGMKMDCIIESHWRMDWDAGKIAADGSKIHDPPPPGWDTLRRDAPAVQPE
jgi:hypothetical protein